MSTVTQADLIENHPTPLRRLAMQLLRDPDTAEDVLQETWRRAMQSPPNGLAQLRGWLETVLRNVVRQQRRERFRREMRERQAAWSEQLVSTVDLVERRQTMEFLTAALFDLDPQLRDCVFLRYFEDLPPRTISRQTGVPIHEVYRRLDRARRLLRVRLGTEQQGWKRRLSALFGLGFPPASD